MLSKIEVRFQSAEGRRRRQAAFARTAPIRRVLFDATTLYGDGIRYHSVHVFCILIKKSIFFFGSRLFRTFLTHSGMIFATLFVVCYFFSACHRFFHHQLVSWILQSACARTTIKPSSTLFGTMAGIISYIYTIHMTVSRSYSHILHNIFIFMVFI